MSSTQPSGEQPEREFVSRELTDAQRAKVKAQLELHDATPPGWRERTLFDLSGCAHTSERLIEVENEHGVWGMMICVDCGAQTAKECPHVHLTWHEEGNVLICDNCGADGT